MSRRWLAFLFLLGPFVVFAACFGERPCYDPAKVSAYTGKDICLSAHVYAVIETEGGTRYLDVCPASGADSACQLTVVSMPADRRSVGSLAQLEGKDIHLRGVVRETEGHYYLQLSEARQLHGGAEKFRPNSELMRGFSAESGITAFRDPALTSHGGKGQSAFKGSISAN